MSYRFTEFIQICWWQIIAYLTTSVALIISAYDIYTLDLSTVRFLGLKWQALHIQHQNYTSEPMLLLCYNKPSAFENFPSLSSIGNVEPPGNVFVAFG